jgi:hypothetical protein
VAKPNIEDISLPPEIAERLVAGVDTSFIGQKLFDI